MLEGEFMAMEESFMKAHCEVFEDKEENKMEYMLIFNTYQQVIEKYILHVLLYISLRVSPQKYLNFRWKCSQVCWPRALTKSMRICWRWLKVLPIFRCLRI